MRLSTRLFPAGALSRLASVLSEESGYRRIAHATISLIAMWEAINF